MVKIQRVKADQHGNVTGFPSYLFDLLYAGIGKRKNQRVYLVFAGMDPFQWLRFIVEFSVFLISALVNGLQDDLLEDQQAAK